MNSQQILAICAVADEYIARLDDTEPSIKRRSWLSQAKDHARNHQFNMVLLCFIAGGVPADEARGVLALIQG